MTIRLCALIALALVMASGRLQAQFSPGELSRVHRQLEGTENCAKCHELGKEISGAKCLDCHGEIKAAIDSKHGYHALVAPKKCVSCHKEHLGLSAQTVVFKRESFDHRQTGYMLTGKHQKTQCERCHDAKNIRDTGVKTLVEKTGRQSYLGLATTCNLCHEDRHRGSVGTECQSCHITDAWVPASKFDHARTKFALTGKHTTVVCAKCHTEISDRAGQKPIILATKVFADCLPCHASPHREKFAGRECKSCHVTDGWRGTSSRRFDHNLTGFKLFGSHARLQCQDCHKEKPGMSRASVYRLPHDRCTDCHTDYHQGEFVKKYGSDCRKCHTEESFTSSTFTMGQHATLRFVLTGAHSATPCTACHVKNNEGRRVFHFASLQCEACHKDRHGGQFTKLMTEQSCAVCHSTSDWRTNSFDHARTSFTLLGKHATTSCTECHKPARVTLVVQYKGTPSDCQSCHKEVHVGQFAVAGKTNCKSCHKPAGWTVLAFNHTTQSVFALTGAHAKVPCGACHKEELIGGAKVRRFKPLPTKCESCHTSKGVKNG